MCNSRGCHSRIGRIGKATKMSANAVREHVIELEERCLIRTERMVIRTKDGHP